MRCVLIATFLTGLTASGALAQSGGLEMTDEELLNKVQSQLEQRTRGLSIVTGQGQTANTTDSSGTPAIGDDGLTNLSDIRNGTVVVPEGLPANRVDQALEINIRIQFEFDSAALAASEQPALEQMCRVMRQATDVKVFQIVGHTDSAGSEEYNKRLSQLRAEEVGRYLVDDCGIAASRLRTVGYGEEFPDNAIDPRAPENRRVELQVLG